MQQLFYQDTLVQKSLPTLIEIIKLFFSVSIAVAWHRFILLNERVTQKVYLRFDRVVWNYFTIGLLLFLITNLALIVGIIPALIAEIIPIKLTNQYIALGLWIFVLALTIISYSYATRISLLLPAKALDENDISIRTILHRTRGNTWRILFGTIICFAVIIPIFITVGFLSSLILKNSLQEEDLCVVFFTMTIMKTLMDFVMLLIISPIYLAFLSLSYRFFVNENTSQ
jgi:hypothetical protein